MLVFLVGRVYRGGVDTLNDVAAVVSDNASREFFAVDCSCCCAFENGGFFGICAGNAADCVCCRNFTAETAVVDNALVRAGNAAYIGLTACRTDDSDNIEVLYNSVFIDDIKKSVSRYSRDGKSLDAVTLTVKSSAEDRDRGEVFARKNDIIFKNDILAF